MRNIIKDDNASVYGVLLYIIALGVTCFMLLLAGQILEPIFNFMRPSAMRSFLLILFPYGLAIFIFIVLSFALLMHMQKSKYRGENR